MKKYQQQQHRGPRSSELDIATQSDSQEEDNRPSQALNTYTVRVNKKMEIQQQQQEIDPIKGSSFSGKSYREESDFSGESYSRENICVQPTSDTPTSTKSNEIENEMIEKTNNNSVSVVGDETMVDSEKEKIEVKYNTDGDQLMIEDDAGWNVL